MRDVIYLLLHLLTTCAKLLRPGGGRTVIAENLLLKQQLIIHNRSRQRAPNLSTRDRMSLPKTPSVNSFLLYFTNRSPLQASDIFEKGSVVLGTAGSSIFCHFWRRSAELLSTTQVLLLEGSPANTKIKQRVGTHDGGHRHEE